ncbi:MAG: hypothetical protein JWN46_2777 [Acidimicrobiales bacterium]|nr:hypothetical protein [Acidimicrobiales bacterium]
MTSAATTAVEVDVEIVAFGRPATEALARRIVAAQRHHPLDRVTVVVPSNLVGLSARRALGGGLLGGPGLANVAFVTAFGLAEAVGSAQLAGTRRLTNPVLAAAVRAVLVREPGLFAGVAGHQATQAAVVGLYGELSRARPDTLERIRTASARGAEVVRLLRSVRAALSRFHDEDDLAAAAARRLADDPSAAAALGAVIWYLPDRLSPALVALVAQLLARTPSSVVVGLTGHTDADAAVVDVCAAAGVAPFDPAGIEPAVADRIISASDPDEEVRAVVREVLALVESGMALDRIAIFHPTPAPYARTLLEQLDGAEIPHNGPATARLADSAAGRTLLAALALPAHDWGRGDVIGLVVGAPIRHGHGLASSGRWDAVSRRAGVVGGLVDWRTKLAASSAQLRAKEAQGREDGDASEAWLASLRADAEAADELASFVDRLDTTVSGIHAAGSWSERTARARQLLAELLGPEQLRTAWPEAEVKAAESIDAALARLGLLDEIEAAPSASTFELAVATELDARTGRVGTFGQGVLVSPLAAAVGLDLDAVFVLGMTEGSCPSFRRDDALLPDADRAQAVAGELLTRPQRLHDQHRALLAALAAGATRTLVLPRGDLRDRRVRLASRWILPTASKLAGGRTVYSSEVAELAAPVVHVIESFAAGVAAAGQQGTLVERDVASLLAVQVAGGVHAHPLVLGPLQRGFRCRQARQGPAFTEWDGNLAGASIPSPATGVPLSPSRLERWAGCPFAYFLADVLRLAERDDPERIVEIEPAARGSLIHAVLERFIGEAIDRPGGPPRPHEPWTDDDRDRMRTLALEEFAVAEGEGLTGRPLTWRRSMDDILVDLDRFLTADDAYRASSGLVPARVEMAFGLAGRAPLELTLPGGRTIAFRGKADRVDVGDDGRLVVTDYKTGRDNYSSALADDPVLAGSALQLGIYAEAARAQLGGGPVEAHYWMATSRGEFRRRGYEWTPDRRARFDDVLETIVEGVESGTFPALPGSYDSFFATHTNCRFCAFDRLCPRDRDDHQQAKAGAPELRLLGRLALAVADEGASSTSEAREPR